MATVIEEAIVRILPSFKDFKPELASGLAAATAGASAEVKVKLNVDTAHLHAGIKTALAGVSAASSTVKLRAEFSAAQMRTGFEAALKAATAGAASSAAAARVRIDVNRGYLKSSLESGIREAVRSVNATTGNAVQVKVEPIIDRRKLDTELAALANKTVTIKVRYDTSGAPTGAGGGLGRVATGGGGGGDGGGGGRRGGSPSGQSSTRLAEFINAIPGVGGIGPNAARAIVSGVTAGAPAIGAALSAAVSGGVVTAGIASAIALAAKDPRVVAAATDLGDTMLTTLEGAVRPFSDALAVTIPRFGTDFAALKPQIAAVFAPLAPMLSGIESGLIGALKGALPGIATAMRNAGQYVDALAAKAPEIGAAFGSLIADVTSPAGVEFFKDLIDFVDATAVAVGKLVKWLGDLNSHLGGVYGVIGTVLRGLVTTVETVASAFGPTVTAGIIAVGAAVLIAGRNSSTAGTQATTAWQRATASVAEYGMAVRTLGVVGGTRYTFGAPTAGETSRASRLGGAVGIGAGVAGVLAGGALVDAGHQTAGGILAGAGTGAALGSMAGPYAALAGAGIGAVAGGLGAETEKADTLGRSIDKLSEAFKNTGTVSSSLVTTLGEQDKVLVDLAEHADKYGTSLQAVVQATASGDPAQIQKRIDEAQAARKKEADNPPWWAKAVVGVPVVGGAAGWAARKLSVQGNDALIDFLKAAKLAAEQYNATQGNTPPIVDATTAAMNRLYAALGTTEGAYKSVTDAAAAYAAVSAMVTSLAEPPELVNAQNAARQYNLGRRSLGDARYSRDRTAEAGARADEAALHGVAEAEHGLANAHFATEQAQRSLTEARKQAVVNLKELRRAVRDLDDNEESLKIRLAQADLRARQTSGLDSRNLIRRSAVLEQHEAFKALADFREDRPDVVGRLRTAEKRGGVEGSPEVVAAQRALTEAQRNEVEQARNVKLAHDNLNVTVEASRRANELAGRAVDDASLAFVGLNKKLVEAAATAGITTNELLNKLAPALDAIDRTFVTQIETHGDTDAIGAVHNVWDAYKQLANMLGIDIGDLNPSVNSGDALPSAYRGPSPNSFNENVTNPRSKFPGGARYLVYADGGMVNGWSPHDRADNIPAMLTAEEFVVNRASTRKHRPLLEAINADRYADGGFVLPMGSTVDRWNAPGLKNIQDLLGANSPGGSSVAAVQAWLRNIVDPLPYVFGATGPNAFDCSGLVGEVWARLTGNPSNRRYFVTGNEREFLASHGFRDGTGAFTIGFNSEHTMGNIGGLNFEAANERSGIHVGSGTSDVTGFPNVMYLPQFGDRFLGSVGVPDISTVTVGGIWGALLRKLLVAAKNRAAGLGGAGDTGKADAGDADVASIAYNTAKSMGANRKAMLALFEAGLVESNMRNLDYGDRDSLGFLQQRPSQGWGSPSEVRNVAHATREFLKRAMANEARYATAGQLAQSVQRSAFPDRYDARAGQAQALLSRVSGGLFDDGGWLQPGEAGANRLSKPEAVLTPAESAGLKAAVKQGPVELGTDTVRRLVIGIVQGLQTRPQVTEMDGREVARAVRPHMDAAFDLSATVW